MYLKPNSNTERKKVTTDYVFLYTLSISWGIEAYVADQKFPAFRETEG